MPANKKYLIQSPWARASKVLAAIFGGLIASTAFHLALGLWLDTRVVMATTIYTMFIVWPLLMLVVYWIEKPWMAWAILIGITLISALGIYLGKM